MNKSVLTILGAGALVVWGWFGPVAREPLLAAGWFALAGAVTNWLAVHMLFERIPFVYGSGVIPSRFEDFKRGIRNLVMGQFFTRENLERFFRPGGAAAGAVDPRPLLGAVDHEAVYEGLVSVLRESPFGGLLTLVGGESALAPLGRSFLERFKEIIRSVLRSEKVVEALGRGIDPARLGDEIHARVEGVVAARLDELTPPMVKEIVHEMIRRHLGWLVVWGGVFGGLIGLITSFVGR
jgi:uncharacterized membrane-anchored protein YjiN (DUF445 family)